MDDLEGRRGTDPAYAQLLADCYACYFAQREDLLRPAVAAAVAAMAAEHAHNLPAFVRAAATYLFRVCHSEHQVTGCRFSGRAPACPPLLTIHLSLSFFLCSFTATSFRPSPALSASCSSACVAFFTTCVKCPLLFSSLCYLSFFMIDGAPPGPGTHGHFRHALRAVRRDPSGDA